jgi:hypothetical protein
MKAMQTPLSSSVPSERRAKTLAGDPALSRSIELALRSDGPIDRPVDLARALKRYGLSLGEAHRVLDALSEAGSAAVILDGPERSIMVDLAALGVAVHRRSP